MRPAYSFELASLCGCSEPHSAGCQDFDVRTGADPCTKQRAYSPALSPGKLCVLPLLSRKVVDIMSFQPFCDIATWVCACRRSSQTQIPKQHGLNQICGPVVHPQHAHGVSKTMKHQASLTLTIKS